MGRRQIQHTIEIERTPEEVFAVVDAHADDGAWRSGFVEIDQTTPGPVGIGTEYRETIKTFGRVSEATVRVRDRRPGRALVYDVDAAGSALVVEYVFEPTGRGMRLTRTIEADLGPTFIGWVLAALLRRSLATDLPALRTLIAAGEPIRIAA